MMIECSRPVSKQQQNTNIKNKTRKPSKSNEGHVKGAQETTLSSQWSKLVGQFEQETQSIECKSTSDHSIVANGVKDIFISLFSTRVSVVRSQRS